MVALSLVVCAVAMQQSPYELPIGAPGTWLVQPGRMTEMTRYGSASAADVARAARGKRFVFLGEQHATAPHQQMQAEIIEALHRDGRQVVVGLEMYQRPKQEFLNRWSSGDLKEEDFLQQSDWKGQWGFDFAFYRPIFDTARRHKIPMLGLNVPRDWVRSVGRGGFNALTSEQRAVLPLDMYLGNKEHRATFDALIGGHPGMSSTAMDNMYAAQVLWDEGMADTIARDMASRNVSSKTVYVVVAGAGHLMYNQGINYRLARRGLGDGITVVMLSSNAPVRVSNGLADFVYVSPEPRASG